MQHLYKLGILDRCRGYKRKVTADMISQKHFCEHLNLKCLKQIKIYNESDKILCFTKEDIEASYCNFSEERVKNAKKVRNQKHYEKKVHESGKLTNKERKEIYLDYLRENPNTYAKKYLGIGRTTFFTLKNELKSAAEN